MDLFRHEQDSLCQSAWDTLPSNINEAVKSLAINSLFLGYGSASVSIARGDGYAASREAGIAYDADGGAKVCFRGGDDGGRQIGTGLLQSARPSGSFTVSVHDDISNVNSNQFEGVGSLSASFFASASVSLAASWRADSSTVCNAVGGGVNSFLGATAGAFSCDLERVTQSLSDFAAATKPHSWSVTGSVGPGGFGVSASIGYKFWKPSGCVDLSQTNGVCKAPTYDCNFELADLTINPVGCWDLVTNVASQVGQAIEFVTTEVYEVVSDFPEHLQTLTENVATAVVEEVVPAVDAAVELVVETGGAILQGLNSAVSVVGDAASSFGGWLSDLLDRRLSEVVDERIAKARDISVLIAWSAVDSMVSAEEDILSTNSSANAASTLPRLPAQDRLSSYLAALRPQLEAAAGVDDFDWDAVNDATLFLLDKLEKWNAYSRAVAELQEQARAPSKLEVTLKCATICCTFVLGSFLK
eukprot:4225934-Pleurochrysis_carterae.AAC.1